MKKNQYFSLKRNRNMKTHYRIHCALCLHTLIRFLAIVNLYMYLKFDFFQKGIATLDKLILYLPHMYHHMLFKNCHTCITYIILFTDIRLLSSVFHFVHIKNILFGKSLVTLDNLIQFLATLHPHMFSKIKIFQKKKALHSDYPVITLFSSFLLQLFCV